MLSPIPGYCGISRVFLHLRGPSPGTTAGQREWQPESANQTTVRSDNVQVGSCACPPACRTSRRSWPVLHRGLRGAGIGCIVLRCRQRLRDRLELLDLPACERFAGSSDGTCFEHVRRCRGSHRSATARARRPRVGTWCGCFQRRAICTASRPGFVLGWDTWDRPGRACRTPATSAATVGTPRRRRVLQRVVCRLVQRVRAARCRSARCCRALVQRDARRSRHALPETVSQPRCQTSGLRFRLRVVRLARRLLRGLDQALTVRLQCVSRRCELVGWACESSVDWDERVLRLPRAGPK